MDLGAVLVISLIIIVIVSLVFKKQMARRTLMETLVFSLLLIVAGGIMAYIANHDLGVLLGYILLYSGLLAGIFAFLLKRN